MKRVRLMWRKMERRNVHQVKTFVGALTRKSKTTSIWSQNIFSKLFSFKMEGQTNLFAKFDRKRRVLMSA